MSTDRYKLALFLPETVMRIIGPNKIFDTWPILRSNPSVSEFSKAATEQVILIWLFEVLGYVYYFPYCYAQKSRTMYSNIIANKIFDTVEATK